MNKEHVLVPNTSESGTGRLLEYGVCVMCSFERIRDTTKSPIHNSTP